MSVRADAAAKTDSHYRKWLQPNTLDSVGDIQVGEKVLLRHGSAEYAALLKKHGCPPLPPFRVVKNFLECNALRVNTRGTGIQPVVKFAAPATNVAMARSNSYELGGQTTQPELSRGDAP
eukprot:6089967-Pleurochrysis_carterae.AAC.1